MSGENRSVKRIVFLSLVYAWAICFVALFVGHAVADMANGSDPERDFYIFSVVLTLMCLFDARYVVGGVVKQLRDPRSQHRTLMRVFIAIGVLFMAMVAVMDAVCIVGLV
ncbi:MAG: hypothetical protein SNH63_05505 [Rikenellaceae bacterium]